MKTARTKLLARLALAAAVSVGLAACGGSSDNGDHDLTELEMARMALMKAADCNDATQQCLDAHNNLIVALQSDLDNLGDDATLGEQQAAEDALSDARSARDSVEMAVRNANRDNAIGMAVTDAEDAAGMLEDDRSAKAIMDAKNALMAAKNAIADGGDAGAYSKKIQDAEDAIARAEALNSIEAAIMAAKDAAVALKDDASVTAVTAAQGLIDAAEMMISDSTHLSEAEKTAYTDQVQESAQGIVDVAKAGNDAAEQDRLMKQADQNRKDKIAAAKALHGVIGAPKGNFEGSAKDDRFGGYDPDDNTKIQVSYGDGSKTTKADLSLDKDTSVAPLGDWTGQRFYRKAEGADKTTYEVHVYSYIGKETPGAKFGMIGVTPTGLKKDSGYKYPLDSKGFLTHANASGTFGAGTDGVFVPGEGFMPGMVELTDVTRTAGTETFEVEDGLAIIEEPGSYHGVSGTYRCTPAPSAPCTATPLGQGKGFMLSSDTWMFKPTDRTARVTNMPDSMYASFGWWMHVKADGTPAVVSAFHDYRGTKPAALTNINMLQGTAKYEGAAVGQYALTSARGDLSLNESGHFTATATLNVDFDTSSGAGDISGTINGFKVGDNGDDRDWSVELKKTDLMTSGATSTSTPMKTVWTIGEDAADEDGSWSGRLRNDTDSGDGDVPEIVTGTFYSKYGSDGKMVGAFGATQ